MLAKVGVFCNTKFLLLSKFLAAYILTVSVLFKKTFEKNFAMA
jgi:hypothetical protein